MHRRDAYDRLPLEMEVHLRLSKHDQTCYMNRSKTGGEGDEWQDCDSIALEGVGIGKLPLEKVVGPLCADRY